MLSKQQKQKRSSTGYWRPLLGHITRIGHIMLDIVMNPNEKQEFKDKNLNIAQTTDTDYDFSREQ